MNKRLSQNEMKDGDRHWRLLSDLHTCDVAYVCPLTYTNIYRHASICEAFETVSKDVVTVSPECVFE